LQGTLSVEVKPQFAGGKLWACGVEFAAIERDLSRCMAPQSTSKKRSRALDRNVTDSQHCCCTGGR
jgi:hypothetical protein